MYNKWEGEFKTQVLKKMKELKNNSFSVLDFLFSKTRKTQIFLKGPMHIKCTVMHK